MLPVPIHHHEDEVAFLKDFRRHFLDSETGLVFTVLDRRTLQPAEDSLFADAKNDLTEEIPGFTRAECWMHENCGMTTGAWLASCALRGDLQAASRALDALWKVYQAGKKVAPGYFPKFYGRRCSLETSTDQVLYACAGMEAYYPKADAADRARIEEMIPAMVDFWMERDYRYHYFSFSPDDWQWPIKRFPPLLLLASRYSDNPRFHAEYERLAETTRRPENCQLWGKRQADYTPTPYEQKEHAWLTVHASDRLGMDSINLDMLLRLAPESPLAAAWRENLGLLWDEARGIVTLDGKYWTAYLYDFDTNEPRIPGPDCPAPACPAGLGTMVARSGLLILRHRRDLAARILPVVDRILQQPFRQCSYFDGPEYFPKEERYKTRFLSGDATANWLWASALRRLEWPDKKTTMMAIPVPNMDNNADANQGGILSAHGGRRPAAITALLG